MSKLKLIDKTITFPRVLIEERMYRAALDYQAQFRRVPDGIILGPCEWLEFAHIARMSCQYPSVDSGPAFMGIPLLRSMRPGVQIVPAEEIVTWIAAGIAEERKEKISTQSTRSADMSTKGESFDK